VAGLGDALGLSARECAEGIRRVAGAEMARALRVVSVERGIDPRGLALVAFGGAGPLHATDLADELGMTTVLCPRASGVLAALGLVVSERRRDEQRSVLLSGDALTAGAVAEAVAALAERARDQLGAPDAAVRVVCDLRYRGQAFELSVATEEDPEPEALREAFAAAHEERYGYRDPEGAVELVTVRVTAAVPGPELDPDDAGPGRGVEESARTVVLAGEEHEARVLTGEPEPGAELDGPAVCELPEATLVVPPGWRGRVEAAGTIRLERAP
jgi:N-methylhydantoinase A